MTSLETFGPLWPRAWNQYHLFSFCLTLLKYLPVHLVLAEWAWFMPTRVLWTCRCAFKAGCIYFASGATLGVFLLSFRVGLSKNMVQGGENSKWDHSQYIFSYPILICQCTVTKPIELTCCLLPIGSCPLMLAFKLVVKFPPLCKMNK